MPERDYHADPVAAAPSLSRSIARLMVEASPLHAYVAHPRLGGSPPSGPSAGDDDMDIGTAAHALFLEGEDKIVRIPVDSYSTNQTLPDGTVMKAGESRALRDAAKASGKIPLKTKQYDASMRVVEALEAFRQASGLFVNGKAEQTIIWDEGDGLWCRCRVDWLPDDPAAPLLDLKTTGGLATATSWGRSCFQFGADIQASMYPRGCEFIRGEPPDGMLFVVVETSPPYAVRVFGLDPIATEVGSAKAHYARSLWRQCLKESAWPGYPPGIEWILPPPWIVKGWEEARLGGYGRAIETENTELIQRMIKQGNWGG